MAGNRSALLVAAFEFQDEKFRQLRAPSQDAEALAGVLGDEGIGGFEVKTLINQPCDVVNQEIEAFCSDRTPDDLLLLYFSCHGIKDATGRLYFAMTNTKFDLLRSTGVSATFVSEQMEYSRSRRIALLLDCCYSGAFVKGLRARASEDVQVKDHFEGRGRAVITASRATEYAFEADDLAVGDAQPSLFTGAVVQGLTTGQADRNGDGLVTIDELYDYVFDEVRGKVAGQTPGRWVDLEGELVVARNPHPPVAPVRVTPAPVTVASPGPPVTGADLSPFPLASVLGAVLVLAAIFTPPFDNRGALIEDLGGAAGPAVLVALSLTAAALLRGPGDSRLGHALAVAVSAPAAVLPLALIAIGSYESSRVAAGIVLLCAGCLLLVVAGLRSIGRLRRAVSVLDRPAAADVVTAVATAGLGLAAAFTYGSTTYKNVAYGGGFSTLAWRLVLLVGLVVALRYWPAGSRLLPPRAVRPVVALLALASLGLFVAYYRPKVAGEYLLLAVLAIVAVASAVIPLTAVLLVPRHVGAALLGSWAAAQGALLVKTPSRWWPYAGALAIAVMLWRRFPPRHALDGPRSPG